MSVGERSDEGLFQLNRQIREVSREIHKLHFDRLILKHLVAQFSRLAFDKLALDLVCNDDMSTVAGSRFDGLVSHVILGRIRGAMRYLSLATVPLTTGRRGEKNGPILIRKLKHASIFFSHASAKRRLAELKEEYSLLKGNNDGLGDIIKRLTEDNTVLRLDIDALLTHSSAGANARSKEQTWSRLADVELPPTPCSQVQSSLSSQRRISTLSQRRMSVSSTTPCSEIRDTALRFRPESTRFDISQPNLVQSGFPPCEFPRMRPTSTVGIERKMSLIGAKRRSGAAFPDSSTFNSTMFGSIPTGSTRMTSLGSVGANTGNFTGRTGISRTDPLLTCKRPSSMVAAGR